MRGLILLIALSSPPWTWASTCPATQDETQIAEYVSRRKQLVSDGSLAKQISEGTYTADTLSLEMYQWWVQLGLASHGLAIDNFVAMITDAGTPQQEPPSKDWSPIVEGWAWPILEIASIVQPMVYPLAGIVYLGVLSYQTSALAIADPTQGGSTDFLKAAQKWREELPSKTTSHLLMVHDFINDLKTNNTKARLVPAYELVTLLIERTPSYRSVFNSYYSSYIKSVVPPEHNKFYMAAMVSLARPPWAKPEVTVRALWAPLPAGLDGCIVKESVMRANAGCIGITTPVLNLTFQALLINRAYEKLGFHTWSGYEYNCNNIGNTSQTGCIDVNGIHYKPGEVNQDGYVPCMNWRLEMDLETDVFEQLRSECGNAITTSTKVATYNYVNLTGKQDFYDLRQFGSKKYFEERTCKDGSSVLVV